jgi:hypothetical protein
MDGARRQRERRQRNCGKAYGTGAWQYHYAPEGRPLCGRVLPRGAFTAGTSTRW